MSRIPYLTVLVAVAGLGHPNFQIREHSERTLHGIRKHVSGWYLWYVMDGVIRQTTDPEVKERCYRVMKTRR